MALLPGDYYHRLRLSQDASRREIKAAFRRLARQYHPDLHPNKPESAAKFQAIREAYEVLVDRVQREHYDQQQAQQIRTGRSNNAENLHTGDASKSAARPRRASRAPQPKTHTEFYIRGVRHALDRRYREALRDYTKAITLEPQLSEAYLRRAEVFYVQGDDTRVLDNCQQAILINSTEAKTYYYQGLSRYRLGYVESALAAFTDAITCDPDDARYHYRRGIAHQDLREPEAAAQDFRRASQLYRQQGDLASAQEVQTRLKSLGSIGQPLLLRLIIKGLLILTWPVRKPFSKLFPRRSRPQNHTSFPKDNHPREENYPRGNRPRDNHPRNKRSSNPRQSAYTPYPKGTYSNPRNKAARSHLSAKHHRSGHRQYWAPGVSSRPNGNYQYPSKNFSSGIFNTLKLMSNPAGEIVPFYYQLAESRQATLIGYALAVLANLCLVLGATQYFETTTWLAASRFWAAGGLAFVAMVFALSLTRMKSRMRGLWAANVYILGASVVPLGFLFVVLAGIHHLMPYLPSQWPPQVALIGMLIAILWAFSHSLIALRSGLWRIQSFSSSTSAWFAPVLLGLGISTGLLVWRLLATSFMITPTGTAIV